MLIDLNKKKLNLNKKLMLLIFTLQNRDFYQPCFPNPGLQV